MYTRNRIDEIEILFITRYKKQRNYYTRSTYHVTRFQGHRSPVEKCETISAFQKILLENHQIIVLYMYFKHITT